MERLISIGCEKCIQLRKLEERHDSLLENECFEVFATKLFTARGLKQYKVIAGVPQGSMLDPLL